MFGSLAGLFAGANSSDTDHRRKEDTQQQDVHSDAFRTTLSPKSLQLNGDSPIKYGSGPRQYCLVESRQSETGKHLETYVTCALADKGTNIPKDLIQQACLDGGGMVRGVFFRFVDEKGQKLSKQVVMAMQDPWPPQESLDTSVSIEETSTSVVPETTRDASVKKPLPETTVEPTHEKNKSVEDSIKPPSLSPMSSLFASVIEKAAEETQENIVSEESSFIEKPLQPGPPLQSKTTSTKVTMEMDTISDTQEEKDADGNCKKRPREEATSLEVERTVDVSILGKEERLQETTVEANDKPKSAEAHEIDATVKGSKKRPREKESSLDVEHNNIDGRKIDMEKTLPVGTIVATAANESSGTTQDEPKTIDKHDKEEFSTIKATKPSSIPQNDGKDEPILPRRIHSVHLSTGNAETYVSIEAAAIETGILPSLIEQACIGGGGTTDGKLYFSFADETQPQLFLFSEKTATLKEGGPIPPSTFDVSTLLPVKKVSYPNPSKPQKIIELVDKGTNKVVCCFRNITKAQQALGFDRNFVSTACLSYGTRFQPDLGTYSLRYANTDQGGPLLAYEYGAHEEDCKVLKETHNARLARWARVMSGKGQTLPPTKKRSYQKKKGNTVKSNVTKIVSVSAKQKSTAPAITIGEAAAAKEIKLNDISVPSKITNNTDSSMICIMCQAHVANVVFEPCHHCVLCSRCSETACQKFCPTCRTTISHRIKPSSIRVVRPRVYGSYSFM